MAWWAWNDGGPHIGLPVWWRTEIGALIEFGMTRNDLESCVSIAMEQLQVPAARKFIYALGVARRYARTRHQQQMGVFVEAEPDLATMGPYIRTASRRVHRPGCRTLERVNPWNARAEASIVPFRPCRICL